MIWFIIILVIITCYLVYNAQKANKPDERTKQIVKQLELLEEKANQFYSEVLGKLEKELQDTYDLYTGKKSSKSIYSKDEIQEILKFDRQELKEFKDMMEKFFRLKERYKHQPLQQQYEIYLDWYNYTRSYQVSKYMNDLFMSMFSPREDQEKSHREDIRKARIEREEIEKRFDQKLAA